MEAYRDQYARLFNAGKKVVVIGVSSDPDTALASWARDLGTPVLFASDVGARVGALYGAAIPGRPFNARHVYVVGPDGRIAYKMVPFRELTSGAYEELQHAVARTAGLAEESH